MHGDYSIKDVARIAGVSISTVSNVINKTGKVSLATAERVEKIAKELDYQADPVARSFKSNHSGQIGVIVEDICGVFYPYVVKGITAVAIEKGYDVIISDAHGVNGDEDAINREKAFFNRFVANRVDGILFVTTASIDIIGDYLARIKERANRKKFTPFVSLERDLTSIGIDSVYYDSYGNAVMAVQHLIDRGCKKIAHISGPPSLYISQQRIYGYITCMNSNSLGVNMKKMIFYGDYSHQSGYRCAMELLEVFPEVDGIFCGNDQMAVGALKALQQKGKRVPDDIMLMGYDDSFISTVVEPAISTIHVPKVSAGNKAAELLFSMMGQDHAKKHDPVGIKMEGHLIVRKSTDKDAEDADWLESEW